MLHDIMPNVGMVMDSQTIASDSRMAPSKPPTPSPTLLLDLATLDSWAFCRTSE